MEVQARPRLEKVAPPGFQTFDCVEKRINGAFNLKPTLLLYELAPVHYTKYEVMDGAPVRGESIPVRLFLVRAPLSGGIVHLPHVIRRKLMQETRGI